MTTSATHTASAPFAQTRVTATTMHAIVQDKYGSPDTLHLREIDTPTIGDDDVLVRVRAASVHFGDVHVMTGTPYLMRYIGFGLHGAKARVRGTDEIGRASCR